MKNKLVILLLVLLTLVCLGCNKTTSLMYIDTEDTIMIQQSKQLKVYYDHQEIPVENLEWTLSDYSIASIKNGELYAKNYGVVVVGVVDKTNPSNYCSKTIEVIPPYVEDIVVTGVHQLYLNKTTTLEAKVVPSIIESPITWESSNPDVLVVDEGDVLAYGVGIADVILRCDGFEKRFTIEVLPIPTSITISGKNVISVNELTYLTFNIDEDVTLSSSNNDVVSVVDNTVIGVNKGTAVITAVKNIDNSVKGTFEITVVPSKNADIEMTQEEKQKIESLLASMTLEQMVGEMFNVGFEVVKTGWGEPVPIEQETGLPYAQFTRQSEVVPMLEFLKDYKFGNFTITSSIGTDRKNLQLVVKTLKNFAVENTGVNPFITISSNGGYLMQGITALPTNIALSNASASTINAVNELYGTELQALGINTVINQYPLNYNNNVLNVYGSDITKAMATATITSQALRKSNVIMVPELANSNYYDDSRELDDIKKTDWKLIETAITNGSPIISLPASVYLEKEDKYYGLIDAEYMKMYIRNELNFDGIILAGSSVLNGMRYVEEYYDYITLGINLGVDMLSFNIRCTNSHWSSTYDEVMQLLSSYNHIINAVKSGDILESRIKEAVTRILLVKIRNNVMENTDYSDFNFTKVASQITNYAPQFISTIGDNYTIEKEEDVLIISESFEYTNTQNSLGDNLRKFFEIRGYKNIDIYHSDKLTPSIILDNAKDYNKIFVAISNVNDGKNIGFAASKMNFIEFMKQLSEKNPNICIIATGMPDQVNKIPNVKNAILLYNYYENNFESLCKVLNNEITK